MPAARVVEGHAGMWLEIAAVVANRQGTCARRNVGAVLLTGSRLREIGWNGMERQGFLTCREGACPRGEMSLEDLPPNAPGYSQCLYLHAEFNVLLNFRHAVRAHHHKGWAKAFAITIYVSSEPCPECRDYAEWAGAELIWDGA